MVVRRRLVNTTSSDLVVELVMNSEESGPKRQGSVVSNGSVIEISIDANARTSRRWLKALRGVHRLTAVGLQGADVIVAWSDCGKEPHVRVWRSTHKDVLCLEGNGAASIEAVLFVNPNHVVGLTAGPELCLWSCHDARLLRRLPIQAELPIGSLRMLKDQHDVDCHNCLQRLLQLQMINGQASLYRVRVLGHLGVALGRHVRRSEPKRS